MWSEEEPKQYKIVGLTDLTYDLLMKLVMSQYIADGTTIAFCDNVWEMHGAGCIQLT